jgi:hypothetical protein
MRKYAVMLMLLAGWSSAALANGAIGERKTGGLVFKQSDTVSILREDLFVSLNKVTVAYRYKSIDDKTQNVTIVFRCRRLTSMTGQSRLQSFFPKDRRRKTTWPLPHQWTANPSP